MNRSVRLSAFCLGLSALLSQLVMLREILAVCSGNELIVAIILGNWLFLTGLGSLVGASFHKDSVSRMLISLSHLLLSFLPMLSLWGIRYFRTTTLPGEVIGLGSSFLLSAICLGPLCILSGLLLSWLSQMLSQRDQGAQTSPVYIWDSIGGIVGGSIFSALLVNLDNPYSVLFLVALINLAAACWFARRAESRAVTGLLLLVSACLIGVGATSRNLLNSETLGLLFPGQRIIDSRLSPFGSLVVTTSHGQVNFFDNGTPVGTFPRTIRAEELVHYGASSHPTPSDVLLISGGLEGVLPEILKYPVEHIDYVEQDPAVFELVSNYYRTELRDPRVSLHTGDPRLFISQAGKVYDLILMSLPEPSSAQTNRLFTAEFFRDARGALKPGGLVSFAVGNIDNYIGGESQLVISSVFNTLSHVFPSTKVLPGTQLFFLASDEPIALAIEDGLKEKGISSLLVDEGHLKSMLSADRLAQADKLVRMSTPPNHDFSPVVYSYQIGHWLSRIQGSLLIPLVLVSAGGVLAITLVRSSYRPALAFGLGSTGFYSMALEILLIMTFQIIHGYVYSFMSIMFTAFLAGGALGACLRAKSHKTDYRWFMIIDAALALLALAFALGLKSSHSGFTNLANLFPSFFFIAANFLFGAAQGAQFALASKLLLAGSGQDVKPKAESPFAIDFVGACLGSFLTAAFLVPIFGILNTLLGLSVLKLLSCFFALGEARREDVKERLTTAPEFGPIFQGAMLALLFVGFGALYVFEATRDQVHALLLAKEYRYLAAGLILLGLAKVSLFSVKHSRFDISRWLNYLIFGGAVFAPIFRCYFLVPYLFCHVCPRKCAFGLLRPYLVPAALIMNLEKRHWCYHSCPIGTLHDCALKKPKHPLQLGRTRWATSLLVLSFSAFSYFEIQLDARSSGILPGDWYTLLFANSFAPHFWTLALAAFFIALALFIPRCFCRFICPVGTTSQLVHNAPKVVSRSRPTQLVSSTAGEGSA